MREIKFRGKPVDPDDGKWVYGDLIHAGQKHSPCISIAGNLFMYGVKPETVGQYTGLNDYIGKEIYEGDIVKIDDDDESGVIGWDDERYMWGITQGGVDTELGEYYPVDIEVIGNIYDNQELLGEHDDR